jgi:hypothetical protein
MQQGEGERIDGAGDTPSDPFGVLAGTRFLGEIQAEGLRAAGALVDRLVHLVDGPGQTVGSIHDDGAPVGPPPVAEKAMGAVTPWVEMWSDLVQRTLDTLQRVRGTSTDPVSGAAQLEVDGSLVPSHPLRLEVPAGGSARSEMWLHNGSAQPHEALAPRCGPLVAADGSTLRATVAFDPALVDALPARSSRGFLVEVEVDGPASPGTYRGTVQVRGAPAVWMPIEVVVRVAG